MKATASFPNDRNAIAAARHYAARVLAPLPVEAAQTIELMVSELATNCVRYTGDFFRLVIDWNSDEVRVEVTDDGEGIPLMQSPAPTEERGRGLRIVDRLSDEWGVIQSPDSADKTVWFTYRVNSPLRSEHLRRASPG